MIDPSAALTIAAGIIIAWCIIGLWKWAIAHWQRNEPELALLMGLFALLMGGYLVLAGVGSIPG